MIKHASVVAILVLGLAACGGPQSGSNHPSGRRDPTTSLIPTGSGWSCNHEGESPVHPCYRGKEACTTASKGKGECVDAAKASCMTYFEPVKGATEWNCFDEKVICEKFVTFLSNQKGPKAAREISYCLEPS